MESISDFGIADDPISKMFHLQIRRQIASGQHNNTAAAAAAIAAITYTSAIS